MVVRLQDGHKIMSPTAIKLEDSILAKHLFQVFKNNVPRALWPKDCDGSGIRTHALSDQIASVCSNPGG